jgi:hypothetical protein
VLLIVLWVRSYWCGDMLQFRSLETWGTQAESNNGRLVFMISKESARHYPSWRLASIQIASFKSVFPYPVNIFGFGFHRLLAGSVTLTVPIWLPVLMCGIPATLFGLRHPKSFSLRTLLIATTLVAVVLGLIVWSVR